MVSEHYPSATRLTDDLRFSRDYLSDLSIASPVLDRVYYADYVSTQVNEKAPATGVDISTVLSFLPQHSKLNFLSSCNGLILCESLGTYSKPDDCRYVCNPATKRYLHSWKYLLTGEKNLRNWDAPLLYSVSIGYREESFPRNQGTRCKIASASKSCANLSWLSPNIYYRCKIAALQSDSNVIFIINVEKLFSYNFITSNTMELCTLKGNDPDGFVTYSPCYSGFLDLQSSSIGRK
ncbi:uncharacterized protein LOC109820961 [Asparagus officinalis]|uniref:uncharacterized protein LOC109820961 n=1 Tax=Asparagus officinalis TaxID=4686 RepID=UPI00098E2B81|nr:uncharacterized protein LOC109820961 [Asparagus officinalis]